MIVDVLICLMGIAALMAAWPPFRVAVVIIAGVLACMAITMALVWLLLTSEGGVAPFTLGVLIVVGIGLALIPLPQQILKGEEIP